MDFEIFEQLSDFTNLFRNTVEASLKDINLHSGQIFLLDSLWKSDGQTQSDLAKNLQVSAPTVYNMVVRLVNSGYVENRSCDQDGRAMRVWLTEAGKNLQAEAENRWHVIDQKLFGEWAETEKMMLKMLLAKFNKKI